MNTAAAPVTGAATSATQPSTLLALVYARNVPESVVILAAGLVGLTVNG